MQECEQMEMIEEPRSEEPRPEEPRPEEPQRVQEKEIARLRAEEERIIECQAQLAERKTTLKAEHRSGHTINLARVPGRAYAACARSKTWGNASAGMPRPLSRTTIRATLASGSTSNRTLPPSGVNLNAFERRLANTFSSCSGSA